jgi:DNA-binding beta-propeller fold protein YncE
MMTMTRCAALLSTVILGFAAASLAQPDDGLKVTQTVKIGGEGGWDYLTVDPATRRFYVTRGTRVMVLDADTLTPVGEIPKTEGVHGVALAPDLGRGFTSNGRANTVTVFDLKTLKTLDEIKVTGENPDAILYDGATKRVFAFNGRSQNATVIDGATGSVVGTLALGGKPEFATADLEGHVYVNLEDKSEVVAIDSRQPAVAKRWPLAPCEEPSGMAIDRTHKRLFIGCGNKLMAVVDATSGRVVATVPIGEGVDANGFDPGPALAYSSNGDGTLTVVHEDAPDRYTVVANVPTKARARTMAVDEKTHRVFLATAEFGPPPSPTADQPRPRPPMVPDTFTILVVGRATETK